MRWTLPLALSLTLVACASAPKPTEPATPAPPPAAEPAAPTLSSGIDLTNFDRSVRPQDDFYRYVNGTWLAKTEIPADKNNYGAFTILQDEAEKNLHVIAEEAAKAGPKFALLAAGASDEQVEAVGKGDAAPAVNGAEAAVPEKPRAQLTIGTLRKR